MNQQQYVIVGQGLAGTLLAFSLLEAGAKVRVVDRTWHKAASRVAAGMWNPVNFRRLILGFKAQELIPELHKTYSALEQKLGQKFRYPKNILKRISNAEVAKLWQQKLSENLPYIQEVKPATLSQHEVLTADNWGQVVEAGVLDVKGLLEAAKDYFISQKIYTSGVFDWRNTNSEEIIISCEGFQVNANPHFNWLPVNANKGEVLQLSGNHWNDHYILNNNKFLFKNAQGKMVAGATYQWNTVSIENTLEGRKEILDGITPFFSEEIVVEKQEAGIRPTVSDRRPILGFHPKNKHLAIFNGLGTKGVLLAPYFAKQMTQLLLNDTPVDEEVRIERFFKKHFN